MRLIDSLPGCVVFFALAVTLSAHSSPEDALRAQMPATQKAFDEAVVGARKDWNATQSPLERRNIVDRLSRQAQGLMTNSPTGWVGVIEKVGGNAKGAWFEVTAPDDIRFGAFSADDAGLITLAMTGKTLPAYNVVRSGGLAVGQRVHFSATVLSLYAERDWFPARVVFVARITDIASIP
jgi:hypothetical protein